MFDQVCEDRPTTCVTFVQVFFMSYLTYLILNESTLFYLDLSASKASQAGKVHNWTSEVAKANKNSKVPGPGTATSTTVISSSRTGRNRTTALSSAVVTVTQAAPTQKRAKLEPVAAASVSAFLDDEDETAERHAALTSPIKGKQRLTSKVRLN